MTYPDLNLKRESIKGKETSSTFFAKESNPNSSFLSTNENNKNKNIFNTKKNYSSNSNSNYRRNDSLNDISNKNNLIGINLQNYDDNNNNSRDPSPNINKFSEISSVKANRLINQIKFNQQNLNNTQLNDKNYNNLNNDNDDKFNSDYKIKTKSTRNLPNNIRNNYLNSSNLQKVNDNNYFSNVNNYTGINFSETPLRENENNNISTIKEGKSLYLNLGRIYDDKDNDRSKSPQLMNLNNVSTLSTNKGYIKNIESNVKIKLNKKIFFSNLDKRIKNSINKL